MEGDHGNLDDDLQDDLNEAVDDVVDLGGNISAYSGQRWPIVGSMSALVPLLGAMLAVCAHLGHCGSTILGSMLAHSGPHVSTSGQKQQEVPQNAR